MCQAQAMDDTEDQGEVYTPTIEDLEEWMDEGGCETACVHAVWVEPDGHCPECGAGSWLLTMGLI